MHPILNIASNGDKTPNSIELSRPTIDPASEYFFLTTTDKEKKESKGFLSKVKNDLKKTTNQ